MRYFTPSAALLIALLGATPLAAQQALTVAQQQLIQTKAVNFVRTYTSQLELLARAREADEKESYKQTIYLRFGKDKGNTRVYNDLVPPKVRKGSMDMETSVQLAAYLNKLTELYPNGVQLSYANPKVSDVFYSRGDNWYFVKVTADRQIDGLYFFKAEQTPYQAKEKVDFFVNAFLQNGAIRMGGIYGLVPHEEATAAYTRVRIVKGQDADNSSVLAIGKPLKVATDLKSRPYKRGREYKVEWEGGLGDDIIQMELVPQDTLRARRKRYEPVLNNNQYTFSLPNDTRIGKYQFKLKNVSTGRSVQTGYFRVSRTIPLAAKAAVLPVAAAGVYLLVKALQPPPPPGNLNDPPLPADQ